MLSNPLGVVKVDLNLIINAKKYSLVKKYIFSKWKYIEGDLTESYWKTITEFSINKLNKKSNELKLLKYDYLKSKYSEKFI